VTPAPAPTPEPEPTTEPSLEAKDRARTAYAHGQEAFARGDYASAQAAFEEAFANVPNPVVLLSIAESAAKQKHIDAALAAYDRYLALRPTAADRADVEQRRASLALTPAQLTLSSDPPGADIAIDGQPTGKRTPAQLQISPGSHSLQLTLSGYEAEPVPLEAAAGAELSQTIALHANAPPPAAAAPPPPPPPPPPPAPPTAAIWVTGSLGAAGIIAGTVLGVLALKERSDFDKTPTDARADRGERLALFSDVGFGIGAMALITTAVLLFTHDDTPPAEQAAQAKLQLIPSISPAGASATAKVRF
jgi:tetratricopeptide (TPR) repeat protein